ncbi:MAG: hypothetical protein WEA28_12270, partial [Xanthobacteraceae bacterium]
MLLALASPFIPAKAGIQNDLHEVRDLWSWVPAFAGTNGPNRSTSYGFRMIGSVSLPGLTRQ